MSQIKYRSGVADGATAIGHELDTKIALINDNAKLLSVKNAGVEKFAIDKDGNILSSGGNSTWVVPPSAGSAGVQDAVNAAGAAGGGVVQLLRGTYTFTSGVSTGSFYTWPANSSVKIQGMGDETVIDVQEGAGFGFSFSSFLTGLNCDPVNVGDTVLQITNPAEYYAAGNVKAGDYISVGGNTGDPLYTGWVDPNFALADGDPVTGQVQLKYPVTRAAIGSTTYASVLRTQGYSLKNLKIIYNGTTDIGIIAMQTVGGLVENVTIEGGPNRRALYALSLNSGARNVVRNCRFYGIGHEVGYDTCQLIGEIESTVELCHFQDDRNAVVVSLGGGSTRCAVRNNTFLGVLNYAIGSAAYGAIDVLVDGNFIERCKYAGIYFGASYNVRITNNHLSNCGNGINLQAINIGLVADNVITDCGLDLPGNGYGIQVYGLAPNYAEDVTISGNIIKNCVIAGITLAGKNLTCTDNALGNAGDNGITVNYVFDSTISDNVIAGGGNYGIAVYLSKRLLITGNVIRGQILLDYLVRLMAPKVLKI